MSRSGSSLILAFNKPHVVSKILMIANFGILLIIALFTYLSYFNQSESLALQASIAQSIEENIRLVSEEIEKAENEAQANDSTEKTRFFDALGTIKKVNESLELFHQLNRNGGSASYRLDTSKVMSVFMNGGVLVFSLLGVILTIIALVTGIFFKDFKDKIDAQVQEKVKTEIDPNRHVIERGWELGLAKSFVARGYMNYDAYLSMRTINNELARVMLKHAIYLTISGYQEIAQIKKKEKALNIPIGNAVLEDLENAMERTQLWAQCNLCFYLVEADKYKLLVDGEERERWLSPLFEEFEAGSRMDLIGKLRFGFGLREKLAKMKHIHEQWHELMDSVLYCEYHFFRGQLVSDPSRLKEFKSDVQQMLSSDGVKQDVHWQYKNKPIWWSRVEGLEAQCSELASFGDAEGYPAT